MFTLSVRTILSPVDFSPLSLHAFDAACALARDYNARIVILHVIEPAVPLGGLVQTQPPNLVEQLWQSLRELQVPGAVATERRLEEGNITESIVAVAEQVQCDVIVIGTHGRSGLRRAVIGSVAESVLRRASCMVLAVKAGSEKGATPSSSP